MFDTALAIGGWSVFGLAILAGIGLNLVGLFGNWIILGAVAIAWAASGLEHFGPWCLGILLVLAILGEVVENIAASFGAVKFGGGKGAAIAAMVGCILGAILGSAVFPVIGTLVGACFGAFAAAALYEYIAVEKKAHEAAWTGFGAALGKVAGMFAKAGVGFVMLGVAAYFLFWPSASP